MIVEFIGCTSSGKSTIAARVAEHLQYKNIPFTLVDVGGHFRYDVVALPWFLRNILQDTRLCRLVIQVLREHSESILCKANLFRNFAKKYGMYACLSKRNNRSHYILDEGTVHTAHNIFVDTVKQFDACYLKRFAEQVSLPDLIVYVRSPRDKLIARTIMRGHKRVQKDEDVARFIDNAIQVFDDLVSFDRIKKRTLVVENEGSAISDIDDLSRMISAYIQQGYLHQAIKHR